MRSGDICVSWIPSADNPADVFTKPLARDLHEKMIRMLNLVRTGELVSSKGSVGVGL
jgi:hypothetical protein